MMIAAVIGRRDARFPATFWPERLFHGAIGVTPHPLALTANAIDLLDEVSNPLRPRRFPGSHPIKETANGLPRMRDLPRQ
jgi:hypothetical protein